jgi:hypothetical protein
MLYAEIIVACSEKQTKHTNAFCGHDKEFLNVSPVVSKANTRINEVNYSEVIRTRVAHV